MSFKRHPECKFDRKGKRFFIDDLERPQDLGPLLRGISYVFKNPQTKDVALYFKRDFRPFPNILTPLAAAIEFSRRNGRQIRVLETQPAIESCRYQSPLRINTDRHAAFTPAGRVWQFDSPNEVYAIVDATVEFLSRSLLWEKGTLHSLEWSLYELLDNVFQHSQSPTGFFMFQVQAERRRLSFAIADQGIGILNSFAGSKYKPASALDAITLAVQRGVTRNQETNMGNGLWGATEIAARSMGQITVSSSGSAIFFKRMRGDAITVPVVGILDQHCPGTIIDAQIDASVSVDVGTMFGKLDAPVNLRLENMEDDSGALVIDIKQMRIGAGTRATGEAARLHLANLIKASERQLLVDLSGVGIISSSFADECFGKLRKQLGADQFNKRIAFRGINDAVNVVMRNAIAQRDAA